MQRFLFERRRVGKQTCERLMIFFYCPECGDELEAEDAIKGSRMKCPSCWKEIMVPRVGAPVKSRREPRYAPEERGENSSGWLPILLVSILALGGIAGIIGVLATRGGDPVEPAACSTCEGSGQAECSDCQGEKTFPCEGRCKGTGRVPSLVGGEDTACPDCGGLGTRACQRCDGYGYVGCMPCRGTGKPGGD